MNTSYHQNIYIFLLIYTLKFNSSIKAGYSHSFRHLEFTSSLSNIIDDHNNKSSIKKYKLPKICFSDATKPSEHDKSDQLLQYMTIKEENNDKIPLELYIQASKRSCLVRNLFEIIAIGNAYEEFNNNTDIHDAFHDMMPGGRNENASWRLKIVNATTSSMDHNVLLSSSRNERKLTEKMTLLFLKFGGKVDLKNPDCVVYALEGFIGTKKVLARLVAEGLLVSCIALFERNFLFFSCTKRLHHLPLQQGYA